MAKKVDPIKAKQAKQKKIIIGGSVVLLLLLALQGPKVLKAVRGAAPAAASTAWASCRRHRPVGRAKRAARRRRRPPR